MEKIKNIEVLRIIGCLAVISLHFFSLDIPGFSTIKNNVVLNGNKAVDLFFILSGFFFMLGFKNTTSIFEFVKKKIIRLHPTLIFTMILLIILPCAKFNLNEALITFFGLNGTMLTVYLGTVGSFWYVSAMFWVLLLYIYLLKNYQRKNIDLFIAVSIFLAYGMAIHAMNGTIAHHVKYYYFINLGLLRALGGIGIGYFLAIWYKNNIENIKSTSLNIFQKLLVTGAEGYCLFFIVQNLLFHKLKYQNQIIFILIFTIMIMLMLIKKGFITKLFDNKIFPVLSKYTYSIYVTHAVILSIYLAFYKSHNSIITNHFYTFTCGYFITAILLGIITYHLVEKPCANYLKSKWL